MLSIRSTIRIVPTARLLLSSQIACRQLSSTSQRNDLFDFFRKAGVKEEKKEVKPQPKTKDVMKDIESGEAESVSNKRVKLRVLGAPAKDESWSVERNGFEVNAWPLQVTLPELTKAEVSETLENVYNKHFTDSSTTTYLDQSLEDLTVRFNYIKDVSRQLGVIIPDSIITKVQTVSDIEEYLVNKVAGRRYDENQPEAIYLDPKEFEGYNITIRDGISEKRNKKLRFKQALADAKQEEIRKQEELLKNALE